MATVNLSVPDTWSNVDASASFSAGKSYLIEAVKNAEVQIAQVDSSTPPATTITGHPLYRWTVAGWESTPRIYKKLSSTFLYARALSGQAELIITESS